mgnify:CR=1 FL=1
MRSEIVGEDDKGVGVDVIDNNSVEHHIGMDLQGKIKFHQCDSYADKAINRTEEENEHSNQARRFARYYVYTQRGYDTVPPAEHPVRIDAVRTAISELDLDEFETLFGDLYEQLNYETGNRDTPVIDLPAESTDPSIFSKNIYLGIDPIETDLGATLAAEHGLRIDQSAADVDLTEVSADELDQWGEFTGEFTARAIGEEVDLREAVYVDHVSDLYVKYPDGPDIVAADDHLNEPNRDPDTVIELLPVDPESLEQFKDFFDHYLKCQIRDSFVEMGIHPPEAFRVVGMGRFMPTWRYDNIEFYPAFHDPNSKAFATSKSL